MAFFDRVSLRQMLTVPYVLLVLAVAAVISWLSYHAGREAVDTLSDYVLSETVNRIAQAVDKHVAPSEAVLETLFPSDIPAPTSIKGDLTALRTRLWQATSLNREANNYAYYGDRDGNFIGLWRFSETEAELRLTTDATAPRTYYRHINMLGELANPAQEDRVFDPRGRPWYQAAQATRGHHWTEIYIDFKSAQLVATRARRVNGPTGEFRGVVATDLSLEHLNEFVKRLKLSPNGLAFIVDNDGKLLATSRGPHISKGPGDNNSRLNARESPDAWIATTYESVRALIAREDTPRGTRTVSFTGPDGATMQAGYARLRDKAGMDWIVAVSAPRSDFMDKVTDNVQRTVWMALAACLLIALVGYFILNLIARNLRELAVAARDVGDGKLDSRIPVERNDEIGDLAKSFAHMQRRLFTDRLTGIANREAALRRLEDRLIRGRRQGDGRPFAVMIVDLADFKQVNERHGHDTGDQVLIEIARRLEQNLRDSDLAARLGGDEFLVFLDNVAHRSDAEAARAKLEGVLAEPLPSLQRVAPDLATFAAGASIGLALYPAQGNDLETLLKHADEDMAQRRQARGAAQT